MSAPSPPQHALQARLIVVAPARSQTSMDLNSDAPPEVNEWGDKVWRLLQSELLDHNPRHAAFVDSCHHHCGLWGELVDSEGVTQPVAFSRWYSNLTSGRPVTKQVRSSLPKPDTAASFGGWSLLDEGVDVLVPYEQQETGSTACTVHVSVAALRMEQGRCRWAG